VTSVISPATLTVSNASASRPKKLAANFFSALSSLRTDHYRGACSRRRSNRRASFHLAEGEREEGRKEEKGEKKGDTKKRGKKKKRKKEQNREETHLSMVDRAAKLNPLLRGWIAYYGAQTPSQLGRL